MLEVKNLVFHPLDNGVEKSIIEDVSFTVEDGEMLVITGPNGGGKSTLAKLMMGIEKPDSGNIVMDGVDITGLSIAQRANMGIGFAFQQPPRFKGMTVKRLLSLAAGYEMPENKCCDYLSGVGLCAREYIDREVDNTLSGGEMKRLEIATVLAKPHKICIFDEPEAGIDLWSFSMLVKQFEKLHENKKESLILISHQERIIRMADRIMVVRDGKVESLDTRENVFPTLVNENTGCVCMNPAHRA
ncbi:MAG: ATP-binding cassette domain-containing protein [Lachnospiraceae bacterium]|nr:ATP-binding cassette domain-containing protein [Lachnospiraceae bacterium]